MGKNKKLQEFLNAKLHDAVREGDFSEIKDLIDLGADVNAKNEVGYTPLVIAVHKNHPKYIDIIKYLIESGADFNVENEEYGTTFLMSAAFTGYIDNVKFLIKKGADINAKNKFGLTALMAAADNGEGDIVEYLIEKGADVNAKDVYGRTALMLYVGFRHRDIRGCVIKEAAEHLIERGADINAKNVDGRTALMYAASNGKEDVVKYLIEKGADVLAKDNKGLSARQIATEEKSKYAEKSRYYTADSRYKEYLNTIKYLDEAIAKTKADAGKGGL